MEESHDTGAAIPLVGSQCVQLVSFVPHGALSSFSVFLASLVTAELEELSRGAVYAAVKQASIPSPHEAGLRANVEVMRHHRFTTVELTNGYSRCA